MGQVTITIDKREYAITCDDGQEAHIIKLSRILDEKARQLSSGIGLVNENMKLAMVGLLLADELQDLKNHTPQVPSESTEDVVVKADENTSRLIDEQTVKIRNLIKEIKPL